MYNLFYKEMQTITAQIASIPDRELLLEKTVNSLLPQVDKLNIMLNGYVNTPHFCHNEKISACHLDNSKGDGAKFYGLRYVKGYIFTCDDDLLYPPDYVEVMIKELETYKDKVILSNHGRIMNEKPVSNSYTDRKAAFHCLKTENYRGFIDIGGTGVMAWHSGTFFPDIDRITLPNMGDIWIAKFASEQGVKIAHNPHLEEWIQYLYPKTTIWDEHFPNPGPQTDLYNSFI